MSDLISKMVDAASLKESVTLVHRIELKNGGEILTFQNIQMLGTSKAFYNLLRYKGKNILHRGNISSSKEAKNSALNLAAMLNEGWEVATNG